MADDINLVQLLGLRRPLIVLDCETTGTRPEKDRIVELGFQVYKPDGTVDEWRSLINPRCAIPVEATAVHRITNAMMEGCRRCGMLPIEHPFNGAKDCPEFKQIPYFSQVAEKLVKGFSNCDFGGQSVRFDLRMLASEMALAKQPWSYSTACVVDTARLEQLAEPRSLSALYERYVGRKHTGAHGAIADVRAAAAVLARQLEVHVKLPRELRTLHELQWPGWIDGAGKFRFVDSIACFSRWGKYADKPMRVADVGYWDFILKGDFAEDVKTLAREAKLGKFPEINNAI